MDLYNNGNFNSAPFENLAMWAMFKKGNQEAKIPALKELVGQWIQMATQKTAGQRMKGKDLDWANMERIKMCILCEAVALVLSGKLDELEADDDL